MDEDEDRSERPFWVKFTLWGVPNRAWTWICFWLSIAVGVACVAYGFLDRRFFVGILFFLAAIPYYAAIRWVDRYGRW
jgi:hypothetical protein